MKKKKHSPKAMIRKRSKNFEKFDFTKYTKSLRRTGLSLAEANEIKEELGNIHNYFSTSELHQGTYKALLKRSHIHAANYNIKQAIFKLGPTGYPFELFVSQLLTAKGYTTKVSCLYAGKRIKHEVDVVAKRQDGDIFCECKFHGRYFHKNDVKVPLYVHSRYLDIKEANPHLNFTYAIFSNTNFSKDAVKYAESVNLKLYSMNYPVKNTFCDIVKKYKVYPVTVLKSLKVRNQKDLLHQKIVVIKQVRVRDLEKLGLKKNEITKVMQEIKILTRPN